MPKLDPRIGVLALLGLCACSEMKNPLGDPVWADWSNGARPVSAYDAEAAGTPTGAVYPAAASGMRHDSWTPIETNGAAPVAPLESAPLPPPPGSSQSAPGTGPHADLGASQPPDPYQSRFIQRTRPLAVTGQGIDRGAAAN